MSSDPQSNASSLKEDISLKNEQSNSSNQNSHKITTFFPVLRGEGRAKMCASKPGDTKQKEILQKLKSKDTMSLRPKNQDTKSGSEQSPKAELISQTKEKLRGNIMSSALKTPLSQVLRRNLEASDIKKEQTDKSSLNSKRASATSNKLQSDFSTLEKKESASESSVVERLRPSQKAKKSFPETELVMSLRRSQKQPSHAAKSFTSVLRSGLKKSTDGSVISATVDKKKDGVDPIEIATNRVASGTRISTQLSFSNSITTSSPVEDAEHAISNQSSNSSGKFKKNRKRQRHFRGATYGLFLSKKKRKIVKMVDESKDDNCSLAGTENSSYLDSDEGNSLMSEDMYTPSEKSLADEEHNPDSQNSSMLTSIDQKHNSSEIKPETVIKIEEDTQLESDQCTKIEENKVQPTEVSECNPSNQEVSDALQDLNDMQWEDSNNVESEKQFASETLKTSQYDDISNESFSNSCKESPVESSEYKTSEVLPETDDKQDIDAMDSSQKIDSPSPATVKEEVSETCEDNADTTIYSDDQDEKQATAVDSDDQDEKQTAVMDSDDQDEKQTAVDSDDQDEKQTTVVDSDDQDEKQTTVVDSDDQDEKQESANYSDDQDEKQANAMDSDDQDEKQVNTVDSDDQDEKQTNAVDSDDQDEKQTNALDSDDQDEKHTTASVKSGDEQENENVFSPEQSPEIKDPNDAHSTIATCVKSRQRIKRRFTDDIVDTEMGLLSINPSIPATRKAAAPRPDPPKDVIETFQSVTHSEAKKGPITKIECIFNSRQPPVMSCTCEGDTYEANLGSEDEGVFCQAVDSIDDKLVGCSNPVVTTRLVRSSVKIPFTIMCEMHLWRLKHHHSCPYCGLFCSQGSFIQCVSTKNKRRIVHLYHEQCQSKEEGIGTFCLHCGATSDLKRVTLEMHMASPPSFFLSQLTNLPLPHVAKARLSIASAAERMKDDEIVDFSFRIPDTGKVLASVGLRSGPEKDELEKLLQMLNDSKEIPNYHTHEEFYTASGEGDLLKVLNILARGIDPNLKFLDHEDDTALHAAAANGQTTVVHLLIQAGAVNDSLNERLYTPLMLAVENNHQDVVFYLIKNGALADFKGENGMSSFHMAAKNGNLEILKILMSSRNVDINSQDDGGWTPIVWASEHDHYEVVKYLLKRGANPNIKDSEGNTGLHWSAFSGSVDISYLYLDFGCDINATNERGDTPLHIAARQDAFSCVTLFLSRGADVQIRNKNNQLPAECVIDKTSDTHLSLSLNMLLKRIAGKYQHRAEKILHKDISRGKEQIAIPCVNEVDDEPPPLDFLYVTENCETTPLNIDRTITSLQSCHCEDDCSSSNCVCSSISYQCWYDKEGLLLPTFNLVDPPMLFECNRACSCWALSCRNRVLQNGITCRLQLIRTKGKGWGVRTLKDIPKGTFICEYVGEMISDSAADKRADDSYLFDLDNRDGETYCLDARYYGNISRFINHLCEPNLVPVKIYVDHQDLNFPRIAFFSSREIKQYEELGFDYCEKFWVIKYKYFTCDCGSAKCKYSKDTIHHTLANYYRRVKEEQQLEEGTLQPTSVSEA